MLRRALEELLRQQLGLMGAAKLTIARDQSVLKLEQLAAKLGSNVSLLASFAGPEPVDQRPSRRELLERAAQALRQCRRDHHGDVWPELQVPNANNLEKNSRRLVLARIQQFLTSLVESGPMHQYVLLLRGRLIASAKALEEFEEAQLDLLNRQLDRVSQSAVGTAHGELVRPGLYARSFWYGAALIGFTRDEYSEDFVRHRSKMVAKELGHLLAMLDDGPDKPAKEAPPP